MLFERLSASLSPLSPASIEKILPGKDKCRMSPHYMAPPNTQQGPRALAQSPCKESHTTNVTCPYQPTCRPTLRGS